MFKYFATVTGALTLIFLLHQTFPDLVSPAAHIETDSAPVQQVVSIRVKFYIRSVTQVTGAQSHDLLCLVGGVTL